MVLIINRILGNIPVVGIKKEVKRAFEIIINGLTPILTEIICEGIEQGVFSTPYPYECMEMVVTYANTIFDDDMVQMTNEDRVKRIQAFIFNIERMLDVERGSLMSAIQMFSSNK